LDQFTAAIKCANQYEQLVAATSPHAGSQLDQAQAHIRHAMLHRKLPHSSTPLAKRISAYKDNAGEGAASFMLAIYVQPDQGNLFQPAGLDSWRGLVDGLMDKYQPSESAGLRRELGAEQAFEQLRVKAEADLARTGEVCNTLHHQYQQLANSVEATEQTQKNTFEQHQTFRSEAFQTELVEHKKEMENLRRLYTEQMGLKAPVEYWKEKRDGHRSLAWLTGIGSFGGIAGAAIYLVTQIHDLLKGVQPGGTPESWRIGTLVLIALFAVWGLHLMTDAAERAVMVQTYLALIEGGKLTNGEDRQLILQALFRPASDGIVKDEGIPASFFEVLTRGPRQ
jgi:hypothetical protein